MIENQESAVTLPSRWTTKVKSPEHIGKTLQNLISAGKEGITELELVRAGCLYSAEAILALKEHGALIEKKLIDWVDSNWDLHVDVNHYTYRGWQITIDGSCKTNCPEEDSE